MSYAAVDLQIDILELFDAAQHSGLRRRGREFYENASIIKRSGEPRPVCVICKSQGADHNCPGIVLASVAFPLPPQRYFETKSQKVRAHEIGNCKRCGARSSTHRCPG
jgi:hypothetical protein